MRTVLTIAGYDPSSGAGVTADLMVFAAHGLFGISAITALTVQSTLGVRASYPVDAGILGETLDCLDEDARPVGIKVGMVGSSANIPIISYYIRTVNPSDVITVLDPILISSSGRKLLESKGIETLHELLPLVDWVAPNVDELGALIDKTVESRQGLAAAAHELQRQVGEGRRGQRIGVLAKGGHLDIPDDLVLTPDGEEHWLTGERIETSATHGTGCALSSAFLSRLVLGDAPIAAARKAKDYVANAMRRAPGIGRGKGPMDLLWPLRGE